MEGRKNAETQAKVKKMPVICEYRTPKTAQNQRSDRMQKLLFRIRRRRDPNGAGSLHDKGVSEKILATVKRIVVRLS